LAGSAEAADEKASDQPKSRHPSYDLLGPNPPPVDSILNPNFLFSQESKVLDGTLWHGDSITELIVGLDVGDVNGDGLNELVYATRSTLYLGIRRGELLEELATWKAPRTVRVISVDLYDQAGDGRALIVVSAQSQNGGPASAILSYDGSKSLKTLANNIPWYLRAYGAAGSRLLAAQKGANNKTEAYRGPVVNATFDGKKLKTSGPVTLPFGVNLYNFNLGPLGQGAGSFIATVTFPDEHLRLYSGPAPSDMLTERKGIYGGTYNFIKFRTSSDTVQDFEYLPSRILFADIDNDGANEIIVAMNSVSGPNSMKNIRSFDGGIIEAFKATDISLSPFFSSLNLLQGPAIDYQLADFDNNGTKDLVVAVVVRASEGILGDSSSRIVSYSNLYSPAAGDQPSN
jgi:hypothetical protein